MRRLIPHEVLPTRRDRCVLSLWIKAKPKHCEFYHSELRIVSAAAATQQSVPPIRARSIAPGDPRPVDRARQRKEPAALAIQQLHEQRRLMHCRGQQQRRQNVKMNEQQGSSRTSRGSVSPLCPPAISTSWPSAATACPIRGCVISPISSRGGSSRRRS